MTAAKTAADLQGGWSACGMLRYQYVLQAQADVRLIRVIFDVARQAGMSKRSFVA